MIIRKFQLATEVVDVVLLGDDVALPIDEVAYHNVVDVPEDV